MKEVRITIQIDLVEGYDRQHLRQHITVTPVPDDPVSKVIQPDYALMDHAFRKLDTALDQAKQSVRSSAKAMTWDGTSKEEAPL